MSEDTTQTRLQPRPGEKQTYRLPRPPGRWRAEGFSQSFKNLTSREVKIILHFEKDEPSVILQPDEQIEIEWVISNPESYWRQFLKN